MKVWNCLKKNRVITQDSRFKSLNRRSESHEPGGGYKEQKKEKNLLYF